MIGDALPAPARDRLAKLLGLLGSSHSGERDAAALAANRLLQQHNLTWQDMFSVKPEGCQPPEWNWRATCEQLAARHDALRPWERGFVGNLPKFASLTAKQEHALSEIAKRVLGDRQ